MLQGRGEDGNNGQVSREWLSTGKLWSSGNGICTFLGSWRGSEPLSRWLPKGIWRELVGMAISDGRRNQNRKPVPWAWTVSFQVWDIFPLSQIFCIQELFILPDGMLRGWGRNWTALCSWHLHHSGGGGQDLQIFCLFWIYTAQIFPQPIPVCLSRPICFLRAAFCLLRHPPFS